MELSTEINKEKGIFIVYIRGQHQRPHDAFKVLRFVIDSYAEHGCTRILVDLTEAEIKGGVIDNYNAANPTPELVKEINGFYFAIVSSEITDNDKYFEILSSNYGHKVLFLDDHKLAMEWLGML